MNHRSLLDDDGDATPTEERGNIFSDEFEDEFEFDGVADGFRPNMDRETDSRTHRDNVPVRTASAHYATHPISPSLSRGPSRESTRKSRTQMNPFVSPEDDDHALSDRRQSLEFEPDGLARRSISSASSYVYARTSSPRFGAGPSHPYGMYQQGTMARTPSAATTSTIRPPPRESFSPNVMEHSYALYPQGVDGDLDDDDDVQPIRQNPVTVGFPGLSQGFTRRIGPDGEDQDIIGEDGHAEQLPPYSRYPEDGPEKMPLLVPTALHSRAPVAGTDPGMPLMHTTLQPTITPAAPQSMTDASDLDRHASRGSMANLALVSSSEESSLMSEKKKWNEKTWREKRKTRVCGIPCIWIMAALSAIIFILAVIGGAVGGFVAGNKHALKAAATVTYYDASPIESPTGVAPPQGTFALMLGQPEETQCDCLTWTSQAPAWDCKLAPNAALGLVVSPGPGANASGAYVFYASYDTSISYGAQLSNMNTTFASFLPVKDNDDPQNGPAFYFQQYYDKVVVVHEDSLSVGDSGSKRRRQGWIDPDFVVPDMWTHRKQVIPAGEQPWFCVWNNTFLEGFIYIQETISTTTTSSIPAATPPPNNTATWSNPYPLPTTANSPTNPSPTPPPTITSTFIAASTTTVYVGPATGYASWLSTQIASAKTHSSWYPHEDEHGYYHGSGDQYHSKRQISDDDLWSQLDTFPYIIKLEERRVQNNAVRPYCQQYQILDDGTANIVTDPDTGDAIIIDLFEQDPDIGSYSTSRRAKRADAGGCHCQWMNGE